MSKNKIDRWRTKRITLRKENQEQFMSSFGELFSKLDKQGLGISTLRSNVTHPYFVKIPFTEDELEFLQVLSLFSLLTGHERFSHFLKKIVIKEATKISKEDKLWKVAQEMLPQYKRHLLHFDDND